MSIKCSPVPIRFGDTLSYLSGDPTEIQNTLQRSAPLRNRPYRNTSLDFTQDSQGTVLIVLGPTSALYLPRIGRWMFYSAKKTSKPWSTCRLSPSPMERRLHW